MRIPARIALALLVLVSAPLAQDASLHVPTEDGTRLAVDVYLPEGVALDSDAVRVPVLLVLTRYWRSRENARPVDVLSKLDRVFLEAGYALLKVDVRGTGASFGSRQIEYGRQEVRDGRDVVAWVIAEPWCDGTVGAYGTSYTGTTAELLAATGHPAIKAVIPGWSDFDLYRSPGRPYGLFVSFIERWGTLVGWMDDNDGSELGGSVRRVDADEDGALLAAAVREHAKNADVAASVRAGEYRDDVIGSGEDSYAHASSLYWKGEIEASGVPMLVFASWLDAGTADGALIRFRHFSNPQKLVILASNHGGGFHASPFAVGRSLVKPIPSEDEQFALRLAFLDRHLKGVENGVDDWPGVRYFNLGEEAFHETDVWPPKGATRERFFLRGEGLLSSEAPGEDDAWDEYEVDFGVTTGERNRWMTQMGGPVLRLDDRGAMDERMLTYTSEPLASDLQVTGTPLVTLRVTSTETDGAFLVYLEDVDPEGRSRYVTEGGLRALHRKLVPGGGPTSEVPLHSFAREDALPLEPGEEAELTFQLWPTSVLFRAGHRIRVAIAGADDGIFERIPAEGTPTIRVSRGGAAPSFLELPVIAP